MLLVSLWLGLVTCAFSPDQDLCPPIKWRAGFLSQGDCILTRSEVFGGHEWLTHIANKELPERDRFPDTELDHIIEGNRRVDFPKELLVHLNNSIIAYVDALTEYHDKPENQPLHFLLNARNSSKQAAAAAHDKVRELTREAIEIRNRDRIRSLTLLGRACHIIQDSYSEAHTVRDEANPNCVLEVKAFIERDPGFREGVRYHGGRSDDTVGHVTPDDSIYVEGRDCRAPQGEAAVRECLRPFAWFAVDATRDYLSMVADLLRKEGDDCDEPVNAYIEEHLSICK
jgi:hypothetical protein